MDRWLIDLAPHGTSMYEPYVTAITKKPHFSGPISRHAGRALHTRVYCRGSQIQRRCLCMRLHGSGSVSVMLFVLMILASPSSAVDLFVSNISSNGGTGSVDDPFGSLQLCVDSLVSQPAGSKCLLTTGTYRLNKTVTVQNLHGTLEQPYTIGAADNAIVTLDGTRDVPGPWTQTNGIWEAEWPTEYPEPWQLFVDDEMMVVARWPNARWDDRSVFDDRKWAHGSYHSTYCGDEMRDTTYAGPCMIVDGTASQVGDMIYDGGGPDLAGSGIDATGAAAVLNIGHWFSFGARVLSHAPGTSNFTYERDGGGGGWKAAKYKPTADRLPRRRAEPSRRGDRVALRAQHAQGLPDAAGRRGPVR